MRQENLVGKTCLVTGANGFIGSRLCRDLVRRGAKVKKLVRNKRECSLGDCFECDLGEQEIPEKVMKDVDIIFHLAGRTHSLTDSNAQDSLYFKTNVEGTKALLEAAKISGIKKFIFFSSVKSMGEENDFRLNEDSISLPITAYGRSKKESEELVLHGNYIEHPTVLRLVMVYGDMEKGNLVKMIKAIFANRFPPLPKIENKRSMIHVDDVVQGAVRAATCDVSAGKIYILSDGFDYSTSEIYQTILQTMGKNKSAWSVPLLILKLIAKIGDITKVILGRRVMFDSENLQKLIGNSFYSSKKVKDELGFSPAHNLYSAIPEIISNIALK